MSNYLYLVAVFNETFFEIQKKKDTTQQYEKELFESLSAGLSL